MWSRVPPAWIGVVRTLLTRGSRLRNRIVSATAEWIAAQDTPDSQTAAGKDTVPCHGLIAILRATRNEAAGGRQQRRDRLPVERDDQQRKPRRGAPCIVRQQRRRAIVDLRMRVVVGGSGQAQGFCSPARGARARRPARRSIPVRSWRASADPGS